MAKGHKLASDGTDNHLVLWDVRPHGLTGGKVEKVCEAASMSLNRNCVPGDVSALSPGGVRIGAPAMTTRGCDAEHFLVVAQALLEVLELLALFLLHIERDLARPVKEPCNLLEVLRVAATGRHRRSADAHTARRQRGDIARDTVAVQGHRRGLTNLLDFAASEAVRTDVPQHQMIVGAITSKLVPLGHHGSRKSLRVGNDRL